MVLRRGADLIRVGKTAGSVGGFHGGRSGQEVVSGGTAAAATCETSAEQARFGRRGDLKDEGISARF